MIMRSPLRFNCNIDELWLYTVLDLFKAHHTPHLHSILVLKSQGVSPHLSIS
jgi:hypothetical protein